jgi:RNA polymerase sigma-B factor
MQELHLEISRAQPVLTQELGRAPTVAELSDRLGLSPDLVIEGLESANAYNTLSLDAPDQNETDATTVLDGLGGEDEALESVEYRESLKTLLAQLDTREKRILTLRFFRGMTQSQIAEEIGISQMHVSRLLARTLTELHTGLLKE